MKKVHVLVKWTKCQTFSIVKSNQVFKDKGTNIELEKIYDIFFENDQHSGRVIAYGDITTCKKMLSEISKKVAQDSQRKFSIFLAS